MKTYTRRLLAMPVRLGFALLIVALATSTLTAAPSIKPEERAPISFYYSEKGAGTILDQTSLASDMDLRSSGDWDGSVRAPAATVTVDTTMDELDGRCDDGDCSLRDAILLADPGDTIIIPVGIYTLALGHLVIDKDLTLSGAGADATIVQAAAEPNVSSWPVVEVFQENGTITVGISGLTLRHGGVPDDVDPGGGLTNLGENVILSHSAVAFNAGLYAGGIRNQDGSLIIQNCAVYGNTEGGNRGGGGIYNTGAMTITNSTVSGNQVLGFDGERADGGGIRHAGSSLTLNNVTVAGNVSTRYGGGIFASPGSTVTVRNSIIAGNFSLDTITPTLDCSGPFESDGYNLIGDGTGCTGFTNGVNGDQVGVDPLLAPLADNGGSTPTRALYNGSPAIDNGSCSDTGGNPVTADQRGVWRPQGSGCDIGAFETVPPAPSPPPPDPVGVNTTADELDGRCDDGDCSLRDAILLASPGDTITITAGIYTLALGHLAIDKDLTLSGAGADATIVQTAAEPNVANWPVIEIYQQNGAITATLSGLTLRHGGVADDVDPGGGLMNQGENVTLSHSVVAFNAGLYAGGIRNQGGSMIIQNCAVYGNTEGSNRGGGGIYNTGAMTITNSTVSGNQVLSSDRGRADGGGIFHQGASLTLNNVTVAGNVSTRYGGGIFASPGTTVTVRNSIIAGNFSLDTITPTLDCSGSFDSGGHNLIGDGTGCTGFTNGINGDQVGVAPLLAPLADNGGSTPTHALYDGSPAIDGGDPAVPGSGGTSCEPGDQRGIPRPQGPGCDIGAFEAVLPAPSPPPPDPVGVNTTADELDGRCDDGDCSLRDAILLASPGDTITITAGIYTLALGHLVIDKDLTLSGAGAETTIVQTAAEPNVANWSVIEIYQQNGAITATLSGLTLRHGGVPDDVDPGGGLMNYGENVTLSHSAVAFNAGAYRGGIRNHGGNLIIQNCAVYGNTEGGKQGGGGINNIGAMTITNSTVSGNQVLSFDRGRADGGGILHTGSSLTLNNVTVAGNVSTRYGGGISAGSTVTVRNSIIAGSFSLDTVTPSPDCSGSFGSGGHNLVGDSTGCTGFTHDVNGDQVGVAPLLAALADNGGSTPTRALYDGSPAIDGGDPAVPGSGGSACEASDQRGISRPQGPGCDIGAFESGSPDLVISKSVTPTTAAPGQAVTYTLTFSNAGVGVATGVVITDIVPLTLTGMSAMSSGVTIIDSGAIPPYVLQVQELAALNRGGVITITGMISPDLSADCVFTNTATITATTSEQNPADNHHQAPLGVVVPRVRFSSAAYTVSEGGGATVITVTLDAPNAYAAVAASYATADGTAAANEDYTPVAGSATIPAGSTYVTFSVTITDDQVAEAAETVLLSLSAPSGAALDLPSDASLTILDNDNRIYLPLVARSYETSR